MAEFLAEKLFLVAWALQFEAPQNGWFALRSLSLCELMTHTRPEVVERVMPLICSVSQRALCRQANRIAHAHSK